MSTVIAVVAIIIALVIGLVGGYFLAPTKTTTTTTTVTQAKLSGTLNIGVAIPLTGDLGTYGANAKAALNLAASQINALLSATNAGYSLNLLYEDTQTKPDIALTATQDLASKGCQVILGYYSSGELRNCMTYAQTNQIVLISPSSTAVSLAIPKDYIFRFVPADDKQGPAMARGIQSFNVSYIVPIWRGDTYGDGLVQATENRMVQLGGNYDHNGIRYDINAKEFSTEVASLNTEVQKAVSTYGMNNVGVYAVTFEEITSIMTSATQYPILSQVKWFGCDGSALSGKVAGPQGDPVVANFSISTVFPATYFAPTNSSLLTQVSDYVHTQTGNVPDPYAYGSYDSLWVVAKAIGLTQQYSGAAIDKVLPTLANLTFGSSGWTQLNQFGDRTIGDYQFWEVYKITNPAPGHAAGYDWRLAGLYTAATDSVTWYP
jgi:branched-chain amino acid transport system substrate-binding protein